MTQIGIVKTSLNLFWSVDQEHAALLYTKVATSSQNQFSDIRWSEMMKNNGGIWKGLPEQHQPNQIFGVLEVQMKEWILS